jgi:hypothetical protein
MKRIKVGGRKKGTQNKITVAIKDMVLGALSEVGGQDYFVKQANDNPIAFMSLLAKILPSQLSVQAEIDMPSRIEIVGVDSVNWRIIDAAKY